MFYKFKSGYLMSKKSILVNNRKYYANAPSDMPLLWFLRDLIHLTGTKFGCGKGICGSCTVHLDKQAVRACSVRLEECYGKSITTIEGLSDDVGNRLIKAWAKYNVPQCGYCQPGQIMQAAAVLRKHPKASRELIRNKMNLNLCRCGTYTRIEKAVYFAAHNQELI